MHIIFIAALVLILALGEAFAAAPITVSAGAVTARVGQEVVLTGRATCSDTDLELMGFYISGPGHPAWTFVSNATLYGRDCTTSCTWRPQLPGNYTVHIRASNTSGQPDSNGNITYFFSVASAAPITQSLIAGDTSLGNNVYVHAKASDVDGDLANFGFYVAGPGLPQWTFVENISTSGANGSATFVWAPPSIGNYTVHFRASDAQGNIDSNGNITTTFYVHGLNSQPQPDGAFDGILNANGIVAYEQTDVCATGWAADPTEGSPVNRVEMFIDGKYAGNATLSASWRQDVVNAYSRNDYGNSGWYFNAPVESLSSGTHQMTAVAYNANGIRTTLGSKPFTVSRRFQILIGVNQINYSEATSNQLASLAADGVWCIPVNTPDMPYYSSISTWGQALSTLNAAKWIVTEDNPDQTLAADFTSTYINRAIDGAMFYYEGRPFDNSVLTPTEISDRSNHTIQVLGNTAYGSIGNKVIVHSRSFHEGDYRKISTSVALAQSACAGVVFESAVDAGLLGSDIRDGVGYTINTARKKCYLLLPPQPPGGAYNYLADFKAAVAYFDQTGLLGNRDVYIIPCVYARGETGVGFLAADIGNSSINSVLAVVNWLKQFRNYAATP